MHKAHLVGVLALSLLALGGCIPNTVTLSLGSNNDQINAAPVIEDAGAGKNKIAMIEIRGLIADIPQPALVGQGTSQIDFVVRRLQMAAADPDVKAVILRVNSPGGTVTGSDILYHEIERFSERSGKPVVASLGEIATSGGYYVSLAADEIVAQPTTITGSIGVIFQTINISEGMARWGIHSRPVTSGPNKAMASPFDPEQEEHYAILQAMVDEFYAGFRGLVIERRPELDPDRIDELTDGRIVTGLDAASYGLVDATGGVREAFARAKELAHIDAAKLIRYHTGRVGPKTAYAESPIESPRADFGTHVSLLDLGMVSPLLSTPTAYYLWDPTLP